jgi:hypothetical protein
MQRVDDPAPHPIDHATVLGEERIGRVEREVRHPHDRCEGAGRHIGRKQPGDGREVVVGCPVVLGCAIARAASIVAAADRVAPDGRVDEGVGVVIAPIVRGSFDVQSLVEMRHQAHEDHVSLAAAFSLPVAERGPRGADEGSAEQGNRSRLRCHIAGGSSWQEQKHGEQQRRDHDGQIGAETIADTHDEPRERGQQEDAPRPDGLRNHPTREQQRGQHERGLGVVSEMREVREMRGRQRQQDAPGCGEPGAQGESQEAVGDGKDEAIEWPKSGFKPLHDTPKIFHAAATVSMKWYQACTGRPSRTTRTSVGIRLQGRSSRLVVRKSCSPGTCDRGSGRAKPWPHASMTAGSKYSW